MLENLNINTVNYSENEQELIYHIGDLIHSEVFLQHIPYSDGQMAMDPDSVTNAAIEIVRMLKERELI